MSEPMKLQERWEASLGKAVAMKRGENLEELLTKEADGLKKAFLEEALGRRQQAADAEADFPPSAMPPLP
jgi:hypothetical protein